MFVPLSFPFPENVFLRALKDKHNLDGSAGDLSVSEKISRSGKEGSFYRFGIDQAMKDCLQEKKYVLRFSIHRTTIFVVPIVFTLATNFFLACLSHRLAHNRLPRQGQL